MSFNAVLKAWQSEDWMYSCVCRRTKLSGTSGRGVQSEKVRDIGS